MTFLILLLDFLSSIKKAYIEFIPHAKFHNEPCSRFGAKCITKLKHGAIPVLALSQHDLLFIQTNNVTSANNIALLYFSSTIFFSLSEKSEEIFSR